MTEEEIIKRFMEENKGNLPDLSDPEQYQKFAEELESRVRPHYRGPRGIESSFFCQIIW